MNRLINDILNSIPKPILYVVGAGIAVLLLIFVLYKGSVIWNGIGNAWFAAKMSWQGKKLQTELESAAETKKELEKTLGELSEAQRNYAEIKQEKDRLEKVFNDQSKTAAEKVAAFRSSVADDPQHTPTDSITNTDLCARAKAIGASAATIAAVCRE